MSYICALRLTDFRSYTACDLELESKPVIFYGPNGAGKTNLLEALSFLSPGRGLRRASLDQIARKTPDGDVCSAWGVRAHILPSPVQDIGKSDSQEDTIAKTLAVGQIPDAPRRRAIKIDGKPSSGTQLAQHVSFMWLTPAQDRLFTGPASDRRKFIDRLSLAHTPTHGSTVSRYEKARSERNRLLSDGHEDAYWYNALEHDMAEFGAKLTLTRIKTLQNLQEYTSARPDTAFPTAALRLIGDTVDLAQTYHTEAELSDALHTALSEHRAQDLRAGRSLFGPHRADLDIVNTDKDMPAADCSTGEQKALLIGLVLSHAHAQAASAPIILLDEVAAHLDKDRRAAFAEELLALGTQHFMTGTDKALFEAFGHRAQFFEIRDNQARTTR